jgi:hypothetical protein
MVEDGWQATDFSGIDVDRRVCERVEDSQRYFIEIWAYHVQFSKGVLVYINHLEVTIEVEIVVDIEVRVGVTVVPLERVGLIPRYSQSTEVMEI